MTDEHDTMRKRFPDMSVRDRARYGLTLALAASLVVWLLAGPEASDRLYLIIANLLAGGLLVASSWSARVDGHRRWAAYGGLVLLLLMAVAIFTGVDRTANFLSALVLLVVCIYVPYIVAIGLARRRRVDAQIVMGAITIYLVIGLASAMTMLVAGSLQSDPMLRLSGGDGDGSFRDIVYFSFVTMATVGYGDITPISGTARAIAILTALLGQLYLIVAVTTAVSMFASVRATRRHEQ